MPDHRRVVRQRGEGARLWRQKKSTSEHKLMREKTHPDFFKNTLYVSTHLENNGSNYSLELFADSAIYPSSEVR